MSDDMSTPLPDEIVPTEPIPIELPKIEKKGIMSKLPIDNNLLYLFVVSLLSHLPQLNTLISSKVSNPYIGAIIKSVIIIVGYIVIKKYSKK